MEEIMVSVLCTAYNHEKYIEECLNGFLMQKTNFKFEVLVHDDCSTDHTAEIIRRYEREYPEIIKGLYEKENQYSQHISILKTILLPCAEGKYIALCEGDDYWIDENKLQMQVDYMEAHPECTFCFTNAGMIDEKQPDKMMTYPWNSVWHGEGVYDCAQIIELSTPPTASMLCKKSLYLAMPIIESKKVHMEDKQLAIVMTEKGYAYGIDRKMSVYRVNVPNSATSNWHATLANLYNSTQGIIEVLDKLDRYTNYMYTELFLEEKNKRLYRDDCEIAEDHVLSLKGKDQILYIYGAGSYAQYCAMYLYGQNMEFEGFVVSDGHKKETALLGYPVYELNEVRGTENMVIITALNNKNLNAVKDSIQNLTWVVGCYEK